MVIWPPPDDDRRRRPASAMARSITDPNRIEQYRKQREMEEQAIRHRQEIIFQQQQKQIQALRLQDERAHQRPQLLQSPPLISDQPPDKYHPEHSVATLPDPTTQWPRDRTQPQPSVANVAVFETRPLSGLSNSADANVLSPDEQTWRRTYVVDRPPQGEVLRNEILNSDEVLNREAYSIDLLARREAFIERVEEAPQIRSIFTSNQGLPFLL